MQFAISSFRCAFYDSDDDPFHSGNFPPSQLSCNDIGALQGIMERWNMSLSLKRRAPLQFAIFSAKPCTGKEAEEWSAEKPRLGAFTKLVKRPPLAARIESHRGTELRSLFYRSLRAYPEQRRTPPETPIKGRS
jgi:hypothetical protein